MRHLPAEVELSGTALCPAIEDKFMEAYWTSPSPQVSIIQPINPAAALVKETGKFKVCLTVVCLDSATGETVSKTCCTLVEAEEEKDEPDLPQPQLPDSPLDKDKEDSVPGERWSMVQFLSGHGQRQSENK